MSDPTRPNPSATDPAPWLLGPDDLRAIRDDDVLLTRLARGERPDPTDPDPIAASLAAWLGSITAGGAR
jgi:hypothetical protein